MPIKDYRFVSPGVQIKEIDRSVLEPAPTEIGPVIIGKFAKGPAFTPVIINSKDQFRSTFGGVITGKEQVSDVWRAGNMELTPSYASIAVEGHLDSAVSPATVVRILGEENESPLESGKAGWKVGDPSTSVSTNSGVYALVINKLSNSSGTDFGNFRPESYVAAMFYITGGAVTLLGNELSGSDETSGSSVWVKSTKSGEEYFTARVYSKNGSSKDITFNLNQNSDKFIRKVFNTNPVATNTSAVSIVENYWLGESYEQFISENIGDVASSDRLAAALVPLKPLDNVNPRNFKFNSQNSKTGWVFSQHLGAHDSFPATADEYVSATANKIEETTKKLFRFVSISKGEFEQENYKIVISNIKKPASLSKYGSFDVTVAKINTNDSELGVVEQFTNVNLDKSSERYIARQIGDKYLKWNYDEKRFIEYGDYDNNSSIIRVEISVGIDNGEYGENLLPFGFFGPPKPKNITVYPTNTAATNTYIYGSSHFGRSASGGSGDNGLIVYNLTASALVDAEDLSSSIVFPSFPMVSEISNKINPNTPNYFGIKKGIRNVTDVPADNFQNDLLRPLGTPELYEASGNFDYSFVFSLDDVVASNTATTASWVIGSRYSGTSYTAKNGGLPDSSETKLLFNKFTLPLYGGFDGVDVTEAEPFKNSLISGDGVDEKSSYVYNAYKVAIESVSDAEVVNMNLLAVPGLTNKGLTQLMIDVCQQRGDSMAVVDLEGDFTPAHENASHKDEKPVSVKNVIKNLKDRNINSSYAAAYFPWVFMNIPEGGTSKAVWVPPSVAAIGTYASSERKTKLWFAPAGFNRGGLKEADTEGKFAAGFKVVNTAMQLTSKQRDELYEVNINPIAKFVNEGIVIFGQKTLQITPSALDRINVRRLLIYLKKKISLVASGLLFDPNIKVTWARFVSGASGILSEVRSGFGLEDFKVVLDETTTTPDLVDRNILYAKIYIKPTRAIEYIAVDFIITKSGASFVD